MIHKTVGAIKVPAIGQGTQGIKDSDIIKRGISLGMTFIDTAEVYGNKEAIGQAIKGIRDKVFISDKFSPEHNGYDDVIKACDDSLKRLGTDYIDLYSMHWPNPAVPIGFTSIALNDLRKKGKIRHFGVCNTSPVEYGAQAVQNEYNLLDRSIESDMLPYCQENNILTVAYSPLEYLHRLPPDRMLWLGEIAFSHQKTLAQISLNWLVSHKTVIVIPKSKDPQHQLENATASDFALSPAELAKIDSLFTYKVNFINPKSVRISKVGKFPQTLDEAKANITNFCPSPIDLAASFRDNALYFKPIKIEPCKTGFELLEGGLRYWAWVIRYGFRPIPALIVGETEEMYIPKPEPKCRIHPGAKWFEVEKVRFCGKCYAEFLIKTIGPLEV